MENTPTGQASANSSASAGVAALVVLMVFFGLMLWVLVGARPNRESQAVAQVTEEIPLPSPTKLTSLPTEIPPAGYSGEVVSQGSSYFGATCSGCHGSDARGIAGLGKDLVNSEFMAEMDDEELHSFIVTGRSAFDPANTTGIEMPARGGNPALTDENIDQIIAYLRTQAGPSLLVSSASLADGASDQTRDSATAETTAQAAVVTDSPIAASPTFTPTPDGGTPEPTVVFVPREFDAAEVYNLSCAGCHGINGEGVEGFGPAILESSLLDDADALLDFLTNGNPDADVEAGDFPHPLSNSSIYTDEEDELQQVIDYLLTLGED